MESIQKESFPWLPRTSTRRHTYRGEHLHFKKNNDLLRKYNNKLKNIVMQKRMDHKFSRNEQRELINISNNGSSCDEECKEEDNDEDEDQEKNSLVELEIVVKEKNIIQSYLSEARAWVIKCIYE